MKVVEGRIFLPEHGLSQGCIGWQGQTITRIAKVLKGDELHLSLPHDRLILPGVIDLHVHLREPGQTRKEDFATGTAAAACGGVTTVVDMPNNSPPTDTLARYAAKLEPAEEKAHVDFGLWAMGRPTTTQSPNWPLFEAAVTGWKVYPYGLTATDFSQTVAGLLARSAKPVVVHAEHPAMLGAAGRLRALADHTAARAGAEAAALKLLAPHDSPRLHLAHLSTRAALEIIGGSPVPDAEKTADEGQKPKPEPTKGWQAVCAPTGGTSPVNCWSPGHRRWLRRTGTALLGQATAEVTPHHLLLAVKNEKLGFYGKVDPPLQNTADNAALWQALDSGLIDCVASDHAPHTIEEKESTEPPSGLPGVETMLPLLLQAVRERRWSLDRLAAAMCRAPAARLGLGHIKGRLALGCHADFMVVNPKAPAKIKADELHSRCGWTPYEGMYGCFPEAVYCRGELVAEDRQVVSRKGYGEFVNGFWDGK